MRVVSCTTSPWWRWYQRAAIGCALAGGLFLLLAGAIAHDSGAVALLVIGAAWTAMGVTGLRSVRRIAYGLRIDDGQVTLVFPGRELCVPAGDILAIQRSRLDTSRIRPLRILTASHGVIKANPRLIGLFDFLLRLRQANPHVEIPDL